MLPPRAECESRTDIIKRRHEAGRLKIPPLSPVSYLSGEFIGVEGEGIGGAALVASLPHKKKTLTG